MPDEKEAKEISEDDLKNMSAEEIAELQRQNCIFCKISNKEIPSKIIHEDADTIAILDINPASEGHILVYPKKHYMIMPHMPEDVLVKVFRTVKLMSHTLLKTLQCKGTTIFVANGVAAGQKAPHVLIHIFPRRENDGLVQLPKYEMSPEQIIKLQATMKPYIHQVFGKSNKGNIKEAEFVEKKEVDEQEKKGFRDSQQKTPEKKDEKKKSDDADAKSSKKVDLDDISRLFG